MLRSGKREEIFDALRVTDDPEAMTQFIHRCREREVTAANLLACLKLADEGRQLKRGEDRKIEDQLMYALIIALGEFTYDEIPKAEQESTVSKLTTWLRDDPSSAIHGAARWLLWEWGQKDEVKRIEERVVPYSPDREWFTREIKVRKTGISRILGGQQTFYLTFVVFPAGDYVLGSPEKEPERETDESRHTVTLDYDFAMLDRELTFAELAAFDSTYLQYVKQYDLTPEHPAMAVDWYDGIRFCRWLTNQSNLPEENQCYPDQLKAISDGAVPDSNGAPRNWPVALTNTGFRLPTEAEWEISSRGGRTHGAFSFGNDVSRLDQYAWFSSDGFNLFDTSNRQIHLGRVLRPNRRGLSDVHGNVDEWCHDWYDFDGFAADLKNPKGRESGSYRVYRGGSWYNLARYCRSANRSWAAPTVRGIILGFRVALVPSALPDSGAESGSMESGRAQLAEPTDSDAAATAER
jgi:formylglycine-generating enzyme required for sulfatase activity